MRLTNQFANAILLFRQVQVQLFFYSLPATLGRSFRFQWDTHSSVPKDGLTFALKRNCDKKYDFEEIDNNNNNNVDDVDELNWKLLLLLHLTAVFFTCRRCCFRESAPNKVGWLVWWEHCVYHFAIIILPSSILGIVVFINNHLLAFVSLS